MLHKQKHVQLCENWYICEECLAQEKNLPIAPAACYHLLCVPDSRRILCNDLDFNVSGPTEWNKLPL